MGQERGLWFPTQRLSSLSYKALSQLGQQDLKLISKTCGDTTDMFSTRCSYHVSTQFSQSYFDGSCGCVNGSSHLQQQFLPLQKPFMMKNMPLKADGAISEAEGQCSQKRFLVFDQSGDRTTLLLTSDRAIDYLKSLKMEAENSHTRLFVCMIYKRNVF